MAVFNQILRRRIAARAPVHADRADTRTRIEVDHGKGQGAELRRFEFSQMLDPAKDD